MLTSPDSNERREFRAGVRFYVVMILLIAITAGIALVGLRDSVGKGHIVLGAVIAYFDCIMIYAFLSRIPLWPWYRGPTLVVDNHGLKTEKWFIAWPEIEEIKIFMAGRTFYVGIIKKGKRSWESPYFIEGPLGVNMNDVVRYLQLRRSGFMEN